MYISNTILVISGSVLALIVLLLIIWIARIQSRLKKVLMGKNAKSLEDSFSHITESLKGFKEFTQQMEEYLTTVELRLKKSIQSVETIRFNPFKGTGSGGNNSFSTAFVNEKGDGVMLTSMYARDRISMFAKPIKNFGSEFELSEEEIEAIAHAKQNLAIK